MPSTVEYLSTLGPYFVVVVIQWSLVVVCMKTVEQLFTCSPCFLKCMYYNTLLSHNYCLKLRNAHVIVAIGNGACGCKI